MKSIKRNIAIMIIAALLSGLLTACGAASPGAKEAGAGEESGIKIVTTIFPIYDWVRSVLGEEQADLTMLLNNGVDLHSYQPTADDIMKISTCDLFIYVGGESDEWVDDALQEATNKDMVVLNLLDLLGDSVKEEEVVEGMQAEEEEESEGEEEEIEYDEHVWLSVRNASVLSQYISEALQKIDPDKASVYQSNADAYIEKLKALDEKYTAEVNASAVKTLLFGDRFPFRYLTDDYGLSYYAAFVGCSAETEASFETVTFLAQKVDELSLHAVMTIEGSDHRIAETIINNTATKDQKILTLDSMQSCTQNDVDSGATYLSIMENNLAVLQEALK